MDQEATYAIELEFKGYTEIRVKATSRKDAEKKALEVVEKNRSDLSWRIA